MKSKQHALFSLFFASFTTFYNIQTKYKLSIQNRWKLSLLYEIISHSIHTKTITEFIHAFVSIVGGSIILPSLNNSVVQRACSDVLILSNSNIPLNLYYLTNNKLIKIWFTITFLYYRTYLFTSNYIKLIKNNMILKESLNVKIFIILEGLMCVLNIGWSAKIIKKIFHEGVNPLKSILRSVLENGSKVRLKKVKI